MNEITIQADRSYIEVDEKGNAVGYIGPDATAFFQAKVVRSAINLWISTRMMVTRGASLSVLLQKTADITGKPRSSYKKSEAGAAKARSDLDAWIMNMRTALPVVTRKA